MPSLRMTLARSLTRLRRPKLAAGRGLQLERPPVRALPRLSELELAAAAPPHQPRAGTSLSPPELTAVMPPQQPAITRLPAALADPETEQFEFDAWPTTTTVGGPASGTSPVRMMAPLLQPPYRAEAEAISALPAELTSYQQRAVAGLAGREAYMLAAEPGLDKTPTALVALADLVQRRKAARTLIVAPAARHRHWLRAAEEWTPGLALLALPASGPSARLAWNRPAHVLLCDPHRLAQDLSRGFVPTEEAPFDLIAVDAALSVLHKSPQAIEAVTRLSAARRWALAGALPDQVDDWRALFSFLLPGEPFALQESVEALRDHLSSHYLNLRKSDLREQIPARRRQEFWLDLDEQQLQAYREALGQERHTLRQLGESVARTHIQSALGSLNRATAFAQGSLDGVKVRALTDMLEALGPAGDKVLLFSQYLHRTLEPLQQALHAYGALVLSDTAGESEREQILATFRRDPRRRVLLAHLEARADGQPLPASHIVHFDVDWNAARRVRAEQRFFPELKPATPLTIREFWVAGTHDEEMHGLLAERGLLASDLPQGTQPSELEGRITVQDWLGPIFHVSEEVSRARARPPASGSTTGLLPGTTTLRAELDNLSDQDMSDAVAALMQALGFPSAEAVQDPEFEGLSLAAEDPNSAVLVRVLRGEDNVGVAEGRALLEEVQARERFAAGYLVSSSDFTSACKRLAEESEGRLSLVSGAEFFRHLRILGWL